MNEMNLTDKLQKLSMLMHRLNRPEPQPHGPRGHAQERALNQIAIRDGLTQRELMERLGVQPSTMSELLNKLEYSGLIERHPNEADRRQVTLHISEDGRRHLEQSNIMQNRFDPFETLTDTEQASFGEMLDRLIQFAEEECRRRNLPMHPPRPFPGERPPFDGHGPAFPPHGGMEPPHHPHHPPMPGFEPPRRPPMGGCEPPRHRPPMDECEPPRPVYLANGEPEENV